MARLLRTSASFTERKCLPSFGGWWNLPGRRWLCPPRVLLVLGETMFPGRGELESRTPHRNSQCISAALPVADVVDPPRRRARPDPRRRAWPPTKIPR